MKYVKIIILILIVLLQNNIYAKWERISDSSESIISFYQYDDEIYAGSFGAIYYTNDSGDTWIEKSTGLKYWSNVLSIDSQNSLFIAGCSGDGIYISEDNGTSWFEKDSGLITKNVSSVEIFDDVIFAGEISNPITQEKGGLFKSIDFGNSWIKIDSISDLDILSIMDYDTILFVASENGLYKSLDKGDNWEIIFSGCIHDIIYTEDIIYISYNYSIYKSRDCGDTWQKINNGLNNEWDYKITCIDSFIFAASSSKSSKIYVSDNFGNNWKTFESETLLPSLNDWIRCITVNNKYLYISFLHGGLWRKKYMSNVDIENEVKIQNMYQLLQNYPNPFNPITNIRYQIPKTSKVKLTIYDINGKILKSLIDHKQEQGYYKVQWDASNFPTGLYFYKIEADNFTEIKKCLLIK